MKTRKGLDATARYNVCDTAVVEAARVETLLYWAVGAGREVSNIHFLLVSPRRKIWTSFGFAALAG